MFIVIILLILINILIYRNLKIPKMNSLVMFTGGVKAGKSTCAVYFAVKEWRSRVRKTKFINFFLRLFHRPLRELPLLYSNIPLAVPYVPLTKNLLLRKDRFVYKSVIYCCEASLICDSQNFKDSYRNEALLLFNKLIGHSTRGGILIYDTQSISDVHYSIKRSLSEYFYVHHMLKSFLGIPLPFLIVYLKECRYSDDGSIVQAEITDTEDTLKRFFIPRGAWKLFDCYAYSSFTDNHPVVSDTVTADSLKVAELISFNTYYTLIEDKKHEK